ncbi:MAG: response regulator transcription factor [Pseudomonadota bacterium]
MRILIVEDEPDLASTIGDYLEINQHQTDFAATGESALELVVNNKYDAILLDVNLPRKDGLAVCAELRANSQDFPILMITARDTLPDVIAGFDSGADDYLVKPFALEEMLARLHAISARGRRTDIGIKRVGELTIDVRNRVVQRRGRTLALNPLQFDILKTLALACPAVVSKEALEALIWQYDTPQSGALRMQIHRLRGVVDDGFNQPLIETVRGRGFRIHQ